MTLVDTDRVPNVLRMPIKYPKTNYRIPKERRFISQRVQGKSKLSFRKSLYLSYIDIGPHKKKKKGYDKVPVEGDYL